MTESEYLEKIDGLDEAGWARVSAEAGSVGGADWDAAFETALGLGAQVATERASTHASDRGARLMAAIAGGAAALFAESGLSSAQFAALIGPVNFLLEIEPAVRVSGARQGLETLIQGLPVAQAASA